jgi:hypothetical protein
VFGPALVALLVLLLPRASQRLMRSVSLAGMLVVFIATCLLAVLIIVGRPAMTSGQMPAAPRIGPLLIGHGLVGSGADQRPGAIDQHAAGPRYVPRHHWSWLFPNTPVPPFASDPLARRHWWLDPLLRRHSWK